MKITQTNYEYAKPLVPLNQDKVLFIILHHPAAKIYAPEDCHAQHLRNGWSGAGYNEYIRKNGDVYIMRGDHIGAQCHNNNSKSYGICCEGDYSIETEMPAAQYKSLVERIKYNKQRFKNLVGIEPHSKFNPTACPGKYFPLEKVLKEINRPQLQLGSNGEDVKDLQKMLFIAADGRFGPLTETAVKTYQENNGLVNDGVVGPKTWAKIQEPLQYFTFPNIYAIKCKPKDVEVNLLGDTLYNAKVNGINGTFFDTPRPTLPESCWGLAIDKGKPLGPNAHTTDWKGRRRGTLWFDGVKMHCERLNDYREDGKMMWGISGVMLTPDYSRWAEGYFADIFRKTNHTLIGYDAQGNLYLIVQLNCYLSALVDTCRRLGLIGAVSLDGGASSQLRYNNKGYKSSRKINSAILLKG